MQGTGRLFGSADALDICFGDTGIDTLIATTDFFSGASDIEIYIVSKEAGAASIGGDDGANKITGNGSANGILGRGGNDTIDGGGGDDSIIAGAGQNRVNVALGNDTVVSGDAGLPAHDLITGFDGNAAGGQDVVSLAQLLEDLGIAPGDRIAHVQIVDKGSTVEIRVDTSTTPGGDGTFDLFVATLQTKDVISVGEDILV